MRCPVCGNLDTETIRINEKTINYSYCEVCKSIFLRDMSLSLKDNEYIPSYLDNHLPREKYGSLFKFYEGTFLFNIGKIESKPKFLEIGFCNLGVLMEASKNWECSANDIVCGEKQRRDLQDNNITLYSGDILTTNINGKFDLIWATHIVEHFSYYELLVFLNKIKSLLSDVGIAFISSPNASLYGTELNGAIIGACDASVGHKIMYSPETFTSIIKKVGFKRCFFSTYTDPFPNEFQYQTKYEWRVCIGKQS